MPFIFARPYSNGIVPSISVPAIRTICLNSSGIQTPPRGTLLNQFLVVQNMRFII
ncbi:MAG: hypothetical protein ACP6IU_09240 [Candidatus Asgardarchaeia archaeon]